MRARRDLGSGGSRGGGCGGCNTPLNLKKNRSMNWQECHWSTSVHLREVLQLDAYHVACGFLQNNYMIGLQLYPTLFQLSIVVRYAVKILKLLLVFSDMSRIIRYQYAVCSFNDLCIKEPRDAKKYH